MHPYRLRIDLAPWCWSSRCMWGKVALFGGHEPAKYTLGVFLRVLMNPLRGLGVAQAGGDDFHRLVVLHVRLSRLLDGLQAVKLDRRDLDRVLEPLRYSSPP